MGRKAAEFGPLAVSRLTSPGLHFVGGVAGLALQVTPSGTRSWVLRVQVGNKRRDMGLGGFPDVTLAGARDAAREARLKVKAGIDPIAHARAMRSALKADQAAARTFKFCALAYIDAHEAGWRNPKHAQQWRNTLETYAYPLIGDLLVRDIALPQVLAVLEPLWKSKTETASRLRGRLESVLDWATTRGYREGLNPARWKGHLDNVLPAPSTVANAGHHAALAVSELGPFMESLRSQAGLAAKALEFTVLTAARSGEVRGARWDEFDMDAAMWTVPAERMKAGKEHRVPLSSAVRAILRSVPRDKGTDLVFASPRGGMLSDMSLTAVLRRMRVGAVPHGFRSTFRDWCSERTNYPREAAEMALAHTIGDKVEAAYRRGDLFNKRVKMMADWAAFCARAETKGAVVPLRKKA
ncbi:MAG TPA: integrase arm-type DNA-binding domain-containing protein [Caldimonas sp.]|jgi:integrase